MVEGGTTIKQNKRVLITRPIEEAVLTQSLFSQHNIECDICPFIEVALHKVEIDIIAYEALVFTSRNAVRAFCLANSARDIEVYCVGESTAALCQENGFKDVQSAGGTVDDLENMLVDKAFSKPILYLRGEDITRPIRHSNIREEIIYHTDKIEEIDSEVWRGIRQNRYDFIVFYSIRTAQAFVEFMTVKNDGDYVKNIKVLCLAPSMVKSLSVLPWQEILVADAPNQQRLLQKIIS